jgi:predicted transcriptional regulator
MRHVAEIDPRTWLQIQELIREGRYESVAQFIAVALQNQIQLEVSSLDRVEAEVPGVQTPMEKAQASRMSAEISLKAPIEEPFLVQSREERSDEVIWGLYNRIFPVKITVRVLARLLVGKGSESIELKTLREEAALQARALGKQLLLADRTRRSGRGERLATGLPFRRGDKSLDRFKNMFVGAMSGQGKVSGFPAKLGFVLFQRVGGRAEVSLTTTGFKFANLKNPVLDEGLREAEGTLSIAESDFFMTHVRRVLPHEWELCHTIIESIPEGSDAPAGVDTIIRRTLTNLNPSMIAPTRAGIISRLDELGFVQRRQDGLRVSYALTKRGESLLQSAQGVTAPR